MRLNLKRAPHVRLSSAAMLRVAAYACAEQQANRRLRNANEDGVARRALRTQTETRLTASGRRAAWRRQQALAQPKFSNQLNAIKIRFAFTQKDKRNEEEGSCEESSFWPFIN